MKAIKFMLPGTVIVTVLAAVFIVLISIPTPVFHLLLWAALLGSAAWWFSLAYSFMKS
jgi:hypothetical protein